MKLKISTSAEFMARLLESSKSGIPAYDLADWVVRTTNINTSL